MAHAAESTHWYDREGRPAYTVAAKDGSQRSTTLRDARKFGYVPSVTTIIRCADRPGLTNWLIEQGIMAALTLPRIDGESSDAFLARVRLDAKEQAKKAADKGTAIHAAIQGYFESGGRILPASGFEAHVAGAAEAIHAWDIGARWKAERSFSCELGFGGKVDLSGDGVVDFKTKEFSAASELKTWDEHAMQLAAYRFGLGMERARCAIVYVSTTVPGLSRLIEIPEEDLQRGWECFKALFAFWKAKNKYDPCLMPALVGG